MAMSEDMVRALFAQQTPAMALLCTIQADGLDDPIRVTTYPEGLSSTGVAVLPETGPAQFLFFPFTIIWANAGQQEPVRQVQVVIGNRDGVIANAVRTVTSQPLVTIELVRVAAPNAVERAMTNCKLILAEDVDPKITGTLQPRQFDTEPYCQASYTIARTPSLF